MLAHCQNAAPGGIPGHFLMLQMAQSSFDVFEGGWTVDGRDLRMVLMHWRIVTIVVILHHLRRGHVWRRVGVHRNGVIAREIDEMTGHPAVDRMHRWCSRHVEL